MTNNLSLPLGSPAETVPQIKSASSSKAIDVGPKRPNHKATAADCPSKPESETKKKYRKCPHPTRLDGVFTFKKKHRDASAQGGGVRQMSPLVTWLNKQ